MSKKMMKQLATALNITAVAAQAGIRMNESPFLGGGGSGGTSGGARNAILVKASAGGGTPTILVQGHDAANGPGDPVPASGDGGWYTLATVNATSPREVEIELAPWMRTNVTVVGTGTADLYMHGVQ